MSDDASKMIHAPRRWRELSWVTAVFLVAWAPSPVWGAPPHASLEEEATSSFSEDASFLVGARAGIGYSRLTRPTDPAGEPTLLYGAPFAGVATIVGASGAWVFGRYLSAEAGLWYQFVRQTGFAQNRESGQRQLVELTAHTARVPLLLKGVWPRAGVRPHLSVGPELLLGFASDADVTYENIPEPTPELETSAVAHVGLTVGAGVSFPIRDDLVLPLEVRLTWDPMVPDATRERFDGYRSDEALGAYEVASEVQVLFLVGVDVLR